MIVWSAVILAVASLALAGACWYERKAGDHARDAATALQDTKAAISEWWRRAEPGR